MSKNRFTMPTAVYNLIERDGKILLARRFNTGWMDGMYTLPAGHIDGNESVFRAMARETKEEINISINEKDLEVVHVIHRKSTDVEYVDFFLKTHIWSGEVKNNEPDKCDDLAWFSLDSLPENTIEPVLVALESIKRNKQFTSLGFE